MVIRYLILFMLLCGVCHAEWMSCPVCDCDYKKDVDDYQHGKGKWCDKKEEQVLHLKEQPDNVGSYIEMARISAPPSTTIEIWCAESNKRAKIDFGGDEITYSGDLPVAQSARIFFDAVFGIYKEEMK